MELSGILLGGTSQNNPKKLSQLHQNGGSGAPLGVAWRPVGLTFVGSNATWGSFQGLWPTLVRHYAKTLHFVILMPLCSVSITFEGCRSARVASDGASWEFRMVGQGQQRGSGQQSGWVRLSGWRKSSHVIWPWIT